MTDERNEELAEAMNRMAADGHAIAQSLNDSVAAVEHGHERKVIASFELEAAAERLAAEAEAMESPAEAIKRMESDLNTAISEGYETCSQLRLTVESLRAQLKAVKAEKARLLSRLITDYECPCGVKADSIDGHECNVEAFGDGPDREVYKNR